MLGMARALGAPASQREVLVLHADHDAADAALATELDEAAKAIANGRSLQWFTAGAGDEQLAGHMDLSELEFAADADVYLCGSNGFLQSLRDQLKAKGVDDSRVHYELFAPNDWLLPA